MKLIKVSRLAIVLSDFYSKVGVMKFNMTFTERGIRMILGVLIIVLHLSEIIPEYIGIWLMIGVVVLMVTGFTGYCPLYALVGKVKNKDVA